MFDLLAADLDAPSCSDDAPEPDDGSFGLLAAGELLERIAAERPGPWGASLLERVEAEPLSDAARVTALREWERISGWVAARLHAAVLAVAGLEPSDDDDFSREEVAAALRLSPAAASRRIALARSLAALPRTAAALDRGEIGFLHALNVAEETSDLTPACLPQVEAALFGEGVPPAPSLAAFRRALRRAVIAADPVRADLTHRQAVTQREVRLQPEPAGMARLIAFLTAEEAMAVFAALTLAAGPSGAIAPGAAAQQVTAADSSSERHAGGDPGLGAICDPGFAADGYPGIDARRADALVALVTGRAARSRPDHSAQVGASEVRHRRGMREANVTVDLATLLGLRDRPGELAGYGPIPPSLARLLAADVPWRLLVTEPETGRLLDRGRRVYRPGRLLRDFVLARDATCRFPGCPRPAEACDLDHCEAFGSGGLTCRHNLVPLCRRHHRMKTHAGWQLRLRPDGACQWISPTGHRYTVPPHRVGDGSRDADPAHQAG